MKKALSLFALFSSIVIFSISSVAQGQAKTASNDQALLQADRDFAKASEAKGAAEAFAMYLADNAMQLPSGANPLLGKQAILAGMGSGYVLKWDPKKAEVARSGDLGWTWGTYEFHTKDAEGKPVVRYGKYVNVWRKQKDSKWKVIVDMGNASPAPGS